MSKVPLFDVEKSQPKKRSKKWPIIIYSVLAIAIIANVISDRNDAQNPNETTISPTNQSQPAVVESTPEETVAMTTEPVETTVDDTIHSGMYKVGSDIDPGTYLIFAYDNQSCYFQVSPPGKPSDIYANGNFKNHQYVTVKDGEYLEINRGSAVNAEEYQPKAASETPLIEGMYKVGRDIPAGEYKLTNMSNSAYFAVYNDARHKDIVENGNFSSSAYVVVKSGQYLILNRCTAEPSK